MTRAKLEWRLRFTHLVLRLEMLASLSPLVRSQPWMQQAIEDPKCWWKRSISFGDEVGKTHENQYFNNKTFIFRTYEEQSEDSLDRTSLMLDGAIKGDPFRSNDQEEAADNGVDNVGGGMREADIVKLANQVAKLVERKILLEPRLRGGDSRNGVAQTIKPRRAVTEGATPPARLDRRHHSAGGGRLLHVAHEAKAAEVAEGLVGGSPSNSRNPSTCSVRPSIRKSATWGSSGKCGVGMLQAGGLAVQAPAEVAVSAGSTPTLVGQRRTISMDAQLTEEAVQAAVAKLEEEKKAMAAMREQ
eukprot:2300982-Prymnesium_polylepis.1